MEVGSIVPILAQMDDYNASVHPVAVVRDNANNVLATLTLSSLSSGLYANNSFEFPDVPFITVQVLVYTDSGHTILSGSEGGTVQKFYQDGFPAATNYVALYSQVATYSDSLYVQAVVRNPSGATVATVNLANVANGLYGSYNSFQMPGADAYVTVQYLVYVDSGYSTLSSGVGGDVEQVNLALPPTPPSVPASVGLVGIIDSIVQNPINGITDTLVAGADRILNVRITQNDTGQPFDVSEATNVQFQFLNADESFTTISLTDAGNPVVVTSGPAGEISCSIPKAVSALFKPMNPAAFAVYIYLPGGLAICNFPYQLQIVPIANMQ